MAIGPELGGDRWMALRAELEAWITALWLGARRRLAVRWMPLAASVAAIVLCVWVLPRALLLADWGLTLQKLLVVCAWAAAAVFVRSLPDRRKVRAAVATAIVVLVASSLTTSGDDICCACLTSAACRSVRS